jgi:thermitase
MRTALLAAAALAVAAPSASASATAPGDRLIVAFDGAARRSAARAAVDSLSSAPIGATGADVLTVPAGTGDDALARLRAREDVRYAEPDRRLHALAVPNDPDFGSLWGLTRIGAPQAWETITDASSVTVAVVDTGVALDQPDLAGELWHNPGERGGGREANGLDDDHDGFVDDADGWDFDDGDGNPYDHQYHGTHVAGTIGAAGNNGLLVTGVAWRATIMPVAALDATGAGYMSNIAAGFEYAADRGARIVNASLGGAGTSLLLRDVMDRHPDTLFVVAAGNDGTDDDVIPETPCDEPSANVLCVAATGPDDGLAPYSNYGGASVDVAAPGTDVLSTVPGGGLLSLSGTSMATPLVTGVAALTLAHHPWLSATGLKAALLDGARPLPALAGKVATGALIDAPGALDASRDAVPPAAPVMRSPGQGAWSAGAPVVRWSASGDSGSGLAGYDVAVDGRPVASVGPAVTALALGSLADGTHSVVVSARDGEGNRAPSAARAFGTDATPPVPPTLRAPAAGAVLRASTLAFVLAPATDAASGVATRSLTVDGRPVALDASGRPAGPGLADGRHTWTATRRPRRRWPTRSTTRRRPWGWPTAGASASSPAACASACASASPRPRRSRSPRPAPRCARCACAAAAAALRSSGAGPSGWAAARGR